MRHLLTRIREVEFFLEEIILAKLVRGPLANMVILDPGSRVCAMESQISNARGCLSSGCSVSRGAPYFTEFSAVYLEQTKLKF